MKLRLVYIDRTNRVPKPLVEISAYDDVDAESAWRQVMLEAGMNRFRTMPLEDCKLFEVVSETNLKEIPRPPGLQS